MRILLVGATGKVGRPILRELVRRGHDVTVLVRDPAPLAGEFAGVRAVAGDVFDQDLLADTARGCDVIISSVAMRDAAQAGRDPVVLTKVLAGVAASQDVRWISLGGAGSLEVAPGVQFVDTPDFPAVARPESDGFRNALTELHERAPGALRWTVVSPPVLIDTNAPRTGTYRIGTDTLLRRPDGSSAISAADLAVAVVDEAERAGHVRARFTVGY
jgi:putative NADH-flavin reductase